MYSWFKCVLSSLELWSQCSRPLNPSDNCHNGANIPKKIQCDLHWKEGEWTVSSLRCISWSCEPPVLFSTHLTTSLLNYQWRALKTWALRPPRWIIYQIIMDLVYTLLRFQCTPKKNFILQKLSLHLAVNWPTLSPLVGMLQSAYSNIIDMRWAGHILLWICAKKTTKLDEKDSPSIYFPQRCTTIGRVI